MDRMLYGGVETGGTWCVCAVGSGPEEIVESAQFHTTCPEETLARIVAFFAAGPAVEALGIGSVGPVDVDRSSPTWGYVTTTPKPGWQHVSVASVVAERLGVPVAFDTDVNAAALGEHRWGTGQGASSLFYLTVGTGIGGGLLMDGRPRHGMDHPSLLEMIREQLKELLGGYLETPALADEIGSYVVAPALGDRAGVLGAIALAQTVEV